MVEKPAPEHVARRASLPWRPAAQDQLTECGKKVDDYPTISYDEFVRKVNVQGQIRASMSTCMTCWNTATRWQTWAVDPLDAVSRELNGMRGSRELFRHELWAIAALVDAHRDEFDGYLHGLQQTTDLAAHRRAKRQ